MGHKRSSDRHETRAADPIEAERDNRLREEIQLRAYNRFLERGGGPGGEIEDWLAAERELLTTPSEQTPPKLRAVRR